MFPVKWFTHIACIIYYCMHEFSLLYIKIAAVYYIISYDCIKPWIKWLKMLKYFLKKIK